MICNMYTIYPIVARRAWPAGARAKVSCIQIYDNHIFYPTRYVDCGGDLEPASRKAPHRMKRKSFSYPQGLFTRFFENLDERFSGSAYYVINFLHIFTPTVIIRYQKAQPLLKAILRSMGRGPA